MTTADRGTGGPSAVGRAGDFMLENDAIRVVIQQTGSARVFGLFGGTIVDADLRRADEGNDQLAEAFPLVNFYVSTGDSVEVLADGSDQIAAVVRVTGAGVPFPMLPQSLLDVFSVPGDLKLDITTDYIIRPQVAALEIVTTATSGQDALRIFQTGDALIADGDQEAFSVSGDPAAQFATVGSGISYAYGTEDGDGESLAISGVALSIDSDVTMLDQGETTSFRRWLTVGDGGASSALQPLYDLRGIRTATLSGKLLDDTGAPAADAEVVVENAGGKLVSSFRPGADGTYAGPLAEGAYRISARGPARDGSAAEEVTVAAGETRALDFQVGRPGHLSVAATEIDGVGTELGPVPIRVSLFRDGGGRIVHYLPSGTGVVDAQPGTYRVVVSRGLEYTIADFPGVVVNAGETQPINAQLERVVDTTGWIAGDFHLHAEASTDSITWDEDRVASVAGEGIEYAVATDHDMNTDYRPAIQALGLQDEVASAIGVETSTILFGHFNSWPQTVDPEKRGRGAPIWFNKPPPELFGFIREGLPSWGVLQVNHPRMGGSYFEAIGFDPATGTTDYDPTQYGFSPGTEMFSTNFDAVEVFNGKRTDDLFGDDTQSPPQKGAIWDWYALLNMGYRFAFTGNSDSHSLGAEAGYPRNYVASSTDDPASVNDQELAEAIKASRNIVCGGPFVTATVTPGGQSAPVVGIGGELDHPSAGPTTVDVAVKIQAPPWMSVDRFHVIVNGQTDQTIPVAPSTDAVRYDGVVTVNLTQDSWLIIHAEGDADLSPVIPGERPLSFTNPIWVDLGGDGWSSPGL